MTIALDAARGPLDAQAAAEEDFSAFFAARYHETLGLVALSCGSPSLAEDVTQEAFARALDRWARVGQMARPDRWVLKVASNLVVDHLRKTRREATLDGGLEARADDHVERIWIDHNLDRLTPMQRTVMLLRHRDGLRVDEVAVAIGRSVETVRTHLRLGRRRMRELCGDER
ncbi:MAG: hypothetical protein QOE92_135 [Chloroflexota bacterium]|nr:hypothetical protein [Chloroflexota bacterium]